MYVNEHMGTAALIDAYREGTTALRRLNSPAAAKQRSGRNGNATEALVQGYAYGTAIALNHLDARGVPREVTGALTEEHSLLQRGVKGRPELRARLKMARAVVAAYVEGLEPLA